MATKEILPRTERSVDTGRAGERSRREIELRAGKTTARIVGVLFITGTAAGILSAVVTGPILGASDYLAAVSANTNQMFIGALLVLIMGLALAMVPVMMFPLFRRYNEALALGAVLFRGALEGTIYLAMVISWVLLVAVSRDYGVAGSMQLQAQGALLAGTSELINPILQIVFSLGALMFYILFYQSRLVPRWLSGWGIIGAVLYLAFGLLAMFGLNFDILLAPLGVQEMILALWLIVKGFAPAAVVSKPETK